MKKIVPFNNVLDFSTDVCEITAISLEHKIKTEEDVLKDKQNFKKKKEDKKTEMFDYDWLNEE